MAGCCDVQAYGEWFGEREVARNVRRYRRKGLHPTAARIVELLAERGAEGASMLEIGGGIGDLQIALLRAGAARAISVELSPAYEAAGRELVAEAGFDGRAEWRTVDVAQTPDAVDVADFVVMNSVVCCYPDMPALVTAAAAKTERYLVMTYPRVAWHMAATRAATNLWSWLQRSSFRFHLHPPDAIVATARAAGLHLDHEERGLIDHLAVFRAG
jgi:predicted RNA methylase